MVKRGLGVVYGVLGLILGRWLVVVCRLSSKSCPAPSQVQPLLNIDMARAQLHFCALVPLSESI